MFSGLFRERSKFAKTTCSGWLGRIGRSIEFRSSWFSLPRGSGFRRKRALPVRPALTSDLPALTELSASLWPGEPRRDLEAFAAAILAGRPHSTLPLVLFVAEDAAGHVVGFIEVGLRSHADGCDGRRPVGFIEGWYVSPDHRGRGVGRVLMASAEAWASAQGCTEMASDTWLDNEGSQRAHRALGFEVVDRCVNFRKTIR
jgi:aminoglycoside 6'-N-acetyltransferase I